MSECSVGAGRVFALRVDQSTGEQRGHFIGALPCSPSQLLGLVRSGQVSASIDVRQDEAGRETFVLKSDPRALLSQLHPLRDVLGVEVGERVRFRRLALLEENRFEKRAVIAAAAVEDPHHVINLVEPFDLAALLTWGE
jgi:hypothetical protein